MKHLPSKIAMSLPQMHSHDYYVRLPRIGLVDIVFEHLYTAQDLYVLEDAAIALGWTCRAAGTSEWHGRIGDTAVSIGWDWAVLDDGDVRLFKAAAPRTNMKVIDLKGYDVECTEAVADLWALIDSFEWQCHVRDAIATEPGPGETRH